MPTIALESAPLVFAPSPQQAAVFDWIENGHGNAFVEAVAGAGKTTTLIEACALMQGKHVAFAAYNKKIADEIKTKVSSRGLDVAAGTFHSFGFSAWRRVATGVKVDEREKWTYLLSVVPELYHGFVKKAVSLAKQRALGVFGSIRDRSEWYHIVDHFDLLSDLDDCADPERGIDYAIDALEESTRIGRDVIDFDDMIYLPLICGARMWQNDWVLVDEAQDTNPARRALARKMLKPGGRIIFVGDRHQAIYGFTGADNDAVDQIVSEFGCIQLPLTITYRCPQTVVSAAQEFVSHIQAHETAPTGLVDYLPEIEAKELQPTDAVLCRLTKPLVEYAYTLIRLGVACHVEGRDIGAGLLNVVNKWKVKTTEAFLNKLSAWETKQIERLTAKGNDVGAQSIADKADTLRVLCEGCPELDQVRRKIDALFQDTNGKPADNVTLSTVHKAKGREWETVYVLGYRAHMPSRYARQAWEQEQERNLIYVAFTRAKARLLLVG